MKKRQIITAMLFLAFFTVLWGNEPYFGSGEFERLLDSTTNSSSTASNYIKLLREGKETYPERLEIIEKARDYIYIQTFIFQSGKMGKEFLEALKRKLAEGVTIKIIYDTFGSVISEPGFLKEVAAAGIEIKSHNMTGSEYPGVGHLWHEKAIIVDGAVAIMGGMNITDINLEGALAFNAPHHRDTDILIAGPSVKDIENSFKENWALLGGATGTLENPTGDFGYNGSAPVRIVVQKPEKQGAPNINNLYIQCINSALDYICIETPYFSPQKELREALINAEKRGVDVKILVNSLKTLDFKWRYAIAGSYYEDLLEAGIEIYEIKTRMLHSKISVFDGVYSAVGTYNLDRRSFAVDSEIVAAIYSTEFSEEVKEWFEKGLTEAEMVSPNFKFPLKNILN